MEVKDMLTLIEAVSESNLSGFTYEEGNIKLKLRKTGDKMVVKEGMPAMPPMPPMMPPMMPPAPMMPPHPANQTDMMMQNSAAPDTNNDLTVKAESSSKKEISGDVVKSPLVGTFYAAPSPEQPPYVKVGDSVTKGQVIGIIEAMKLMNEIESEKDGVIKEILVNNADVVEYDQPLFVIE